MAAEAPVRLGMVRLTDAAPVVYAFAAGLFAAEGVDVRDPRRAILGQHRRQARLGPARRRGHAAPARHRHDARPSRPRDQAADRLRHQPQRQRHHPRRAPGRAAAARGPDRAPHDGGPDSHAVSTPPGRRARLLDPRPAAAPVPQSGGIDTAPRSPCCPRPRCRTPSPRAGSTAFAPARPGARSPPQQGAGRTIAVTSEIAPDHPEKCLAVRADWADKHQAALHALLRALGPRGRLLRRSRPHRRPGRFARSTRMGGRRAPT